MERIRNRVYQLKDLLPGDRFYFVGKKTKLGTVQKRLQKNFLAGNENIPVKMDGDGKMFETYYNQNRQVVFLRASDQ